MRTREDLTDYDLQTNIRNEYGVHINIHWHGKFDFVVKKEPNKILNEKLKTYDTYEECLKDAIKWSLKYIKNDNRRTFNT